MYPRVYFPDLTTRASLAEIDSVDLAALDFLVGAMAVVVGQFVLLNLLVEFVVQSFVLYSTNDQGSYSE